MNAQADQLRRDHLLFTLLSCILQNQLHGRPCGSLLTHQQDLIVKATAELNNIAAEQARVTK